MRRNPAANIRLINVNAFIPGPATVHIFGGAKKSVPGCSSEDGARWATTRGAQNIAVFCFETAELAFSDESVRFQLMIASGFPVGAIEFQATPFAPWLRSFNGLHECSAFEGIAVYVRKGVSLQQMSVAPYGPVGTIVHGPIVGAPAPGAALIANWPPAAPDHLLGRQALNHQMQQQVAQTGTASQLLTAMQVAGTFFVGKPALPFGTGGFPRTRLQKDLQRQVDVATVIVNTVNDIVNTANMAHVAKVGAAPIVAAKPPPGPKVRGVDGSFIAFPLFGPPAKGAPPAPVAPLAPLPPVPKLPAAHKAKAPVAVPRAPEFPAPSVAWPKAGAVPPVPFAVPAKAAPLLPDQGGEPEPAEIPNDLVGRKASDILQRVRDINLPDLFIQGAVLSFLGMGDEALTANKVVAAAICKPFTNRESYDLTKALLIATEPYTMSMLLAERQLLMSFAHVAPADRQAVIPLVAGGFGFSAELRMADNLTPLSPIEMTERDRLACQPEPSMMGAEVTPLALEVQRQLVMRYGYSMSPTLLATIRYNTSGQSGWPVNVVLSVPYSTCGRDDHAMAGTNRLTSQSVVPHPCLGIFGEDSFKVAREFKYSTNETARALLFRWSVEHRMGRELPLMMIQPLENEGFAEPVYGQASVASILTAPSHGDLIEPTLFMTELPDPTRVGLIPRQSQPELHGSNALLNHEDFLINLPWGSTDLQRSLVPLLRDVDARVFDVLDASREVFGVWYEQPCSMPVSKVSAELSNLRVRNRFSGNSVAALGDVRTKKRRDLFTESSAKTKVVRSEASSSAKKDDADDAGDDANAD